MTIKTDILFLFPGAAVRGQTHQHKGGPHEPALRAADASAGVPLLHSAAGGIEKMDGKMADDAKPGPGAGADVTGVSRKRVREEASSPAAGPDSSAPAAETGLPGSAESVPKRAKYSGGNEGGGDRTRKERVAAAPASGETCS